MKPLQAVCTLSKLHIAYNDISDKVANDIATIVSCNTKLNEIKISRNKVLTTGAIKLFKALQRINTLKYLDLNHCNITEEAASVIATIFSFKTDLQELNLGGNHLQPSSIIKLLKVYKRFIINKIYIDHSNITQSDEVADDIAAAISCNIHMQELNLGSNNLQTSGAIQIANSLQMISSLTKLSIEHNNLTYQAADDIAAVIS